MPRWKIFGERTIYDNPWVRLVQVDVEPPDGHRFWHHVVRLQTVAAAVVIGLGYVIPLGLIALVAMALWLIYRRVRPRVAAGGTPSGTA